MNEQALYLQTKQIQLDEYEAKLRELKEKASVSDKDTKSNLNEQIKTVALKLKDAKAKLEAIANADKKEHEPQKKAIDDAFRKIYAHLAMS